MHLVLLVSTVSYLVLDNVILVVITKWFKLKEEQQGKGVEWQPKWHLWL